MTHEEKNQRDRDEAHIERQEMISDRADVYLACALLEDEPFTEGLANWAINKAMSGSE